jgi:hypothetical protein
MKPLPRQLALPLVALALALGLCAGCKGDPVGREIGEYHAAMSNLAVRNKVLADEFLTLAAKIHGKEADADAVAQTWQDRIVPLANEIKAGVADIQPTAGELREIHSQVVSCWTERADSYTQLLATFRSADAGGFKAAVEKNQLSKAQEEAYFTSINNLLGAYDYHLFQHPG